MKKLLLTFAFVFIAVIIKANHNFSELNLRMFDHSTFAISVNHQAHYPSNEFRLNLAPGKYLLQVYKQFYDHHGHLHNQMVFSGHIHISARKYINAMIDHRHRFTILNQSHIHYTHTPAPPTSNGYFAPPPAFGMSPMAFHNLKMTISNASFEDSKFRIAQETVVSNGVTSSQVLEIMELFSFESTKLKFAKQAYNATVDKQNYFLVNNGFSFNSSISNLNNYISRFS